MKKETCKRTSRSGMRAGIRGTRLRGKIWLRERRIEESHDGETMEDGSHAVRSGDGACGWTGLRTDAERGLWVPQCSEHRASGGAGVRSGREVRCGGLPVVYSGAGGGRGAAGGTEFLRDLPQHAVHHNAVAAAGGDMGGGIRKNDEGVWGAYSRGHRKENHGASSGTLRAGESEGIAKPEPKSAENLFVRPGIAAAALAA